MNSRHMKKAIAALGLACGIAMNPAGAMAAQKISLELECSQTAERFTIPGNNQSVIYTMSVKGLDNGSVLFDVTHDVPGFSQAGYGYNAEFNDICQFAATRVCTNNYPSITPIRVRFNCTSPSCWGSRTVVGTCGHLPSY